MAVKLGFVDESGKLRDKEIVSFCGLVSTDEEWREFQPEWRYLLRHHGIECLHVQESRLAVEALREFIVCIKTHIEFGVAVAVDAKGFKALPEEYRVVLRDDPYYFAFSYAMGAVLQCLGHEHNVCIMCDEEEYYFIKCFSLLSKFKLINPALRKRFCGFCSGRDEDFPQIQAADLLSSVVRNEAGKRFLGIPYEFTALAEEFERPGNRRLKFSSASTFWSQDALRQHVDRFWNNERTV